MGGIERFKDKRNNYKVEQKNEAWGGRGRDDDDDDKQEEQEEEQEEKE